MGPRTFWHRPMIIKLVLCNLERLNVMSYGRRLI